MNKMPCHITDEHVYNPWDWDGPDESDNDEDKIVPTKEDEEE